MAKLTTSEAVYAVENKNLNMLMTVVSFLFFFMFVGVFCWGVVANPSVKGQNMGIILVLAYPHTQLSENLGWIGQ